jgi:hypothetical protein
MIPVWCNDETLSRVKKEFLDYWKPKIGEVVGPEDAGVFVTELDKLLETCAANAKSKAEQSTFEFRRRIQDALDNHLFPALERIP